jgi:hypothetical protein
MRLHLPPRETTRSFVSTFTDQLSSSERIELISSSLSNEKQLIKDFFHVWTVKEAYTKALGLGLGFDFSRLSLQPVHAQSDDVIQTVLYADGTPVQGWEIQTFELDVHGEAYVGATARFVGVQEQEHADAQLLHGGARLRHREVGSIPYAEEHVSGGVTRTLASAFVREAMSALADIDTA